MSCEDDEIASNLNSEGAPRVVTATAITETELVDGDPAKFVPEQAFFCSTSNADKVNPRYCPEGETAAAATDVTPARALPRVALPARFRAQGLQDNYTANPINNFWFIRVVFNELLDPDRAETLLQCRDTNHDGSCEDEAQIQRDERDEFDQPVFFGSLATTQPVTLSCGGSDVRYDGWYDPSGSHLTDPPGPSLIVVALDYQATSGSCEITMKSSALFDKDNNAIISTEPFRFSIAELSTTTNNPKDEETGVALTVSPSFSYNGLIDEASLAGKISFTGGTTPPSFTPTVDGKVVTLALAAGTMLEASTPYTITIDAGITDIKGGATGSPTTITFTTGSM